MADSPVTNDETTRPPNAPGGPGPEVTSPLLRDDLVIIARQRAGDPVLPETTVEAALAATIDPEPARFDVVELPGPLDPDRLGPEFARQGHRVFSLGVSSDAGSGVTPVPFTEPAGDVLRQDAVRLAALAALRRTAAIETAVLILRDPAWADVAVRARERWGWRVIAEPGSGPIVPRLERAAGLVVSNEPIAVDATADQASRSGPVRINRAAGWDAISAATRNLFPLASVIVVSFNTLAFTRLCVASILANTEYPNYELILVDNGSSDGSANDLSQLAERYSHLRVIRNPDNRGFGPANNQGLTIARGEILVLLNSDTMVPAGWLTRLAHHLDDPRLGLIGPATNRTCNEAQVAAPYTTYGEFQRFTRDRAAEHDGQRHPIRMPMMFCVAWRRDVLREVGLLDERYETGMFEDEDYALRVNAAGYEVAWAADAYVHHAYHASIGKLLPSGDYVALFRRNQAKFEEKWGICWESHRARPAPPPQ